MSYMNEPLEKTVGQLLRVRGWRLAVAESCTGGLIGHRVTNVPGSSTYYLGSITAYAYEAKVRLLGVEWKTLEKYGAVSKPVVIQMATGVRRLLAADIGLSVSGIAGPGGGTQKKPVGLTFFGISIPEHQQAWNFLFQGNRIQNKAQASEMGLQLLIDFLRSDKDGSG
jgi:PncC family amidohydrolase